MLELAKKKKKKKNKKTWEYLRPPCFISEISEFISKPHPKKKHRKRNKTWSKLSILRIRRISKLWNLSVPGIEMAPSSDREKIQNFRWIQKVAGLNGIGKNVMK